MQTEEEVVVKRHGRTTRIPHDIIVFDILTRLPVKSLSRFRCVSKLWNSAISDRRFVESHQNRAFFTHSSSSTTTTVLITVPEEPNHLKLLLYSVPQPENEEEEEDPVAAAAQVTLSGGSVVGLYISQSIYGLICLIIGSHLKICNPSTREFITLPLITTTIPPTTDYQCCSKNSFGYDPINNQHKVLSTMIFWHRRGRLEIELIMVVHSVFVIGVGVGSSSSCWRVIDDGGHLHCPDQFGNDVCINGVVYNKANTDIKDPNGSQVLVAFDVRLETFRFIAKPVIDPLCFDKSTLIRFDGHLAVVDYTDLDDATTSMDFWVLEDSIKPIWIKKTIVLSAWVDIREDFRVFSIGTIDTGEVVLAPVGTYLHEPYYLFYLSLKNGSVRRVEVRGLPDLWRLRGEFADIIATDHVENILSLSNLNS